MNNPYLVCSDRELRALPTQWLLAERWEKAGSLLSDLNFAMAKTGRIGIDELLQDFTTAVRFLPQSSTWLEKLKSIDRTLDRQAYGLRNWNTKEEPAFFLQQIRQMRNEAFAQEWQAQAEVGLEQLKKPYLLERFPMRSDPAELRTLVGQDELECVALSADGHLAVSGSEYKPFEVWDVTTGRRLRTIEDSTRWQTELVHSIALSADGRLAASINHKGDSIEIWDTTTGHNLRTLEGNRLAMSVALSADGQLAISGFWDKTLKVWDVRKGQVLYTLAGHSDSIRDISLSADGHIAISVADSTLKVWNLTSGHELCTLTGVANSCALSADGRLAVFALLGATLQVWDLTTRRELYTLAGCHWDYNLQGLAMSADGRIGLAISASDNKILKVWDVTTGRELGILTGHNDKVVSVTVSADGRLAVSGSKDGALKVWDLSAMLTQSTVESYTSASVEKESVRGYYDKRASRDMVKVVALSADGRLAVSASDDGVSKVWDVETGHEQRTLTAHGRILTGHSVALSADGRLAISASDRKKLKLWDVTTGRELHTLIGYGSEIGCVALSANGKLAIAASNAHADYNADSIRIKVWEVATRRKLRKIIGPRGDVQSLVMSADGRLAASATNNSMTFKVWEISTGSELHTLDGYLVAMSADGRLAISIPSDSFDLKVWNVTTGRELHTLTGHSMKIKSIALSANGRLAVSTSSDNTLKVWDVKSGHCIATMLVGTTLHCSAISADGKTIIAGSWGGRIHILKLVGEIEGIEVQQDLKWLMEPSFDWSWVEEVKMAKVVEARSSWLSRLLKWLLG